jgi:DNA mismatch endonuclease (patch repair protein)
MADRITKKKRSRVMSRIRSKNTSLEISFKKLLDKNNLRGYKMHPKMLGGPDFVFPKKKLVVFIDGDFWHGYNWKKLHKIPPRKYWQAKISRTIARDKEYTRQLKGVGWKVLRFWEHEVKKNPEKCIKSVKIVYSHVYKYLNTNSNNK